ncbi:ABC transporter permease [Arcticibacter sp. MXS-1]|uniref:ABC transporter permease n=1 Tax=Arcticibacter sp. MXS-1 TaxID=3341726 RepID=UPI0035A9868D
MSKLKDLNFPWLFRMAWRDSRRSRSRLFLFVSSIILGIAALVAVYSFGYNLQKDIDSQAAELTGADLVVSGNKLPAPQMRAFLSSLGGQRSEERSFVSMVYFLPARGTRLVQVHALEGGYPYYGSIDSKPREAAAHFRTGRLALIDNSLMLQFGVKKGDSIKVGKLSFGIDGVIDKAPGQTGFSAGIAPIIYIPLRYLPQTGLLQRGSRVNYNYYFKLSSGFLNEANLKRIREKADKEGMDVETVETQKQNTGRAFADLTRFLSLVGFIALLLGCVGVASSINIYIREKIASVAILRCLGVSSAQAFLIYLIQILAVGFIGSLSGAALGTLIQQLLPLVLRDFLPIEVTTSLSVPAILQGIGAGMVISLLFALLPLLRVRNISPLNTLRSSSDEPEVGRDWLTWIVYAFIAGCIILFSWLQLHDLKKSLYFSGGVLLGFLVLSGTAWGLIWTVRRYFPSSWSYLWRQGLANLFRLHNQTLVLIVSIGLGTAFISTLLLVQDVLMKQVSLSSSGRQPNMVLFDIQPSQKDALAQLTRRSGLPVIQEVPIVTMRVEEIKGLTAAKVKKDSSAGVPVRAFSSEIRATFRDTLSSSEKITEGKWSPQAGGAGVVKVSLEENYARRINVKVGDPMVFNVQGALIQAEVGSLRQVDWNRVQTNFRVVFPLGVLEEAPQFHVLMTRVPSTSVSVDFQKQVVRNFPNVSIIDLNLVLGILDSILSKIGFVIRFMAGFCILTGLIVLLASVMTSRYQRMKEAVLLRTLGGSSRQIFAITALEYFFLGALAAFTGIILSFGASWALATYSFEAEFAPQIWPVLVLFLVVCLLTVVIGLLNSRVVLKSPPLEVLRKEV